VRTSRDAALETSATHLADVNKLKVDNSVAEGKAQDRLEIIQQEHVSSRSIPLLLSLINLLSLELNFFFLLPLQTRELQQLQTQLSTCQLEADKVPGLTKEVALKTRHAERASRFLTHLLPLSLLCQLVADRSPFPTSSYFSNTVGRHEQEGQGRIVGGANEELVFEGGGEAIEGEVGFVALSCSLSLPLVSFLFLVLRRFLPQLTLHRRFLVRSFFRRPAALIRAHREGRRRTTSRARSTHHHDLNDLVHSELQYIPSNRFNDTNLFFFFLKKRESALLKTLSLAAKPSRVASKTKFVSIVVRATEQKKKHRDQGLDKNK